jgi:hypothetical protein
MNQRLHHPNTTTLIAAWERITDKPEQFGKPPRAAEHGELMANLFVIDQVEGLHWIFRSAGSFIDSLFGRSLIDHEFGCLWPSSDRALATTFLSSVQIADRPGILRTRCETLLGETARMEMTLAPLGQNVSPLSKTPRLLGLMQPLEDFAILNHRPIWRQRLTALYPPETGTPARRLRLVSTRS